MSSDCCSFKWKIDKKHCPCNNTLYCHTADDHYCSVCQNRGYTHNEENCPLAKCILCKGNHLELACPNLCPCSKKCSCGGYHKPTEVRCQIYNEIRHRHKWGDKCKEVCHCENANHILSEHVCIYCKEIGYTHDEYDCPKKCPCITHIATYPAPKNHTLEEHVCKYCKKIGYTHFAFQCPEKCSCGDSGHHRDHALEEHVCKICKKIGYMHLAGQCPELCPCEKYDPVICRYYGVYHSLSEHVCYICKKNDYHPKEECPELCPCGMYNFHSKHDHYCNRCKEFGDYHSEEECPELCSCEKVSYKCEIVKFVP